MKHKVADLSGALLDAAVAQCGEWRTAHEHYPTMTLDPTFDGWRVVTYEDGRSACLLTPRNPMRQDPRLFAPSTAWEHGGPIIERERIAPQPETRADLENEWGDRPERVLGWEVRRPLVGQAPISRGPTYLIAAMRAYVASKFGDEVELP